MTDVLIGEYRRVIRVCEKDDFKKFTCLLEIKRDGVKPGFGE